MKIKLYEHEVHRNETTFRPFLKAQDMFREVGIEFTSGDTYDYAFVGQASIIDKKKPLKESISNGLDFVSKIFICKIPNKGPGIAINDRLIRASR